MHLFGDISCGLMRLKLNCDQLMTTLTFGGKKGEARKPDNTFLTVKYGKSLVCACRLPVSTACRTKLTNKKPNLPETRLKKQVH